MHELAMAQSLLAIIERTADDHGGGQVESAALRLGALTHVEPESLSFAFDVLSRGTCAAGCRLRFTRVPVAVQCPTCAFVGEVSTEMLVCPECQGVGLKVTTGREIELVSIELEAGSDA